MKFIKYLPVFCLIHFIYYGALAQSLNYQSVPANIDSSKFAHIYFFREQKDSFPDNWMGVIINNDSGLCVKASMGKIYKVNTVLKGQTRFWSSINGNKTEISLQLNPDSNYYVELKPVRQDEKKIIAEMKILSNDEGISRLNSFSEPVQNRYSILPNQNANHDYRENVWADTITWYASKKYSYLFRPLPSWEIILRSPINTALVFRNKWISNTYSEVGGILYQEFKGKKTESEFEEFCKTTFLNSTIIKGRNSLINWDINSISKPEGIQYAYQMNIELSEKNQILSKEKDMMIRSSYIIYFWRDPKGESYAASIYDSERGLPEELHQMKEIEERVKWVWKSFRLVQKEKN